MTQPLTNCSTCANDRGEKCEVLLTGTLALEEEVRLWWAANTTGVGDGSHKPGATGCPGFAPKAESLPTTRAAVCDLGAIGARAEAATPGPWAYDDGVTDDHCEPPERGKPRAIYDMRANWIASPGSAESEDGPGERDDANGRFIAHARTDIPALIALVAAKDAELAELRAVLAAERGDVAGALEGWEWAEDAWHHSTAPAHVWRRDSVPTWEWNIARSSRGEAPTAREAMRAAETALTAGATR